MSALLKIMQSYLISFNLFLSMFNLFKNKYFFLQIVLLEELLIIKSEYFF